MKFESGHFDILLAQLLMSDRLLGSVVTRISSENFVQPGVGGKPFHAIMYGVISAYYQEFANIPDMATLITGFEAQLVQYIVSESQQEALRNQFIDFLDFRKYVEASSEPLARAVIKHITETAIYRPAVRDLISEANSTRVYDGLAGKLIQLETKRSEADGGQAIDRILDVDTSERGERAPTLVNWVDSRLGAGQGPVRGCGMAVIAPQGVGKTSMGIQICVNQALAGMYVLLVLAEEGLSGSVQRKITACATGIPYPYLEKHTISEAIENYSRDSGKSINPLLVAKKLESIQKYFKVLDLVRTGGGMDAIDAELAHLRVKGEIPSYVYVDWAGIIASKDPLVASGKRTKESALKDISYRIADMAVAYDNNVIIAQQMSPAQVKSGWRGTLDHYGAADCRGFTEPLKYVFVISPLYTKNDLNLNILNIPKARDDARQSRFPVRLSGEIATFMDVSMNFDIVGSTIRQKSSTKASTSGAATVV